MIHSIRVKFTLWYIGSFFAVLILAFAATETFFQHVTMNTVDAALYEGAQRLERALSTCFPVDRRSQDDVNDCFDKHLRQLFPHDIVYAQVMKFPENAAAPVIIAQSYSLRNVLLPFSQETYPTARNNIPHFESLKNLDIPNFKEQLRFLTLLIHDSDRQPYLLQMGVPLFTDNSAPLNLDFRFSSRAHIFSIILFAALILIALLAYVFMKNAFAPVHKMVTLAKTITAEDLSHRIDAVNSRDEIGELADTLNEMIARLERSFRQITQFSGDVSHELKTPLTALKGEIEVALRKERQPAEYQEILRSLLDDTNTLEKMIENLLFLAKMDAHSLPLTFTELPLDELLLEVYEDTYRLAEEKRLTVHLKQVEQATVKGDAGLLKRVFANLIINAVKFTPSGGKIELAVTQNADAAVVTISDSGIGIPESALPFIFDRFYRVDQSRFHETGGSGLGLAIAHKIVEAHHGRIKVTSEVGKGTTFNVFL